jgi:poly(3-hydroxybutyrate) depolymerase
MSEAIITNVRHSQTRYVGLFLAAAVAVTLVAFVIWRSRSENIDADLFPHELIEVDGVPRTFRLVIPLGTKNGPAAVVFAFHGIGDAPGAMPKYADLDRLACQHQFVLVYPEARGKMWTTVGPLVASPENPDIQFFAALLDHVKQRQIIDERRIYLMGMSNGASFAQMLARENANEIAAVVAHSGPLPQEWWSKKPSRDVPILLVVGQNDAIAPIEECANMYEDRGQSTKLQIVPGIGHAWAKERNEEFWDFLEKHPR